MNGADGAGMPALIPSSAGRARSLTLRRLSAVAYARRRTAVSRVRAITRNRTRGIAWGVGLAVSSISIVARLFLQRRTGISGDVLSRFAEFLPAIFLLSILRAEDLVMRARWISCIPGLLDIGPAITVVEICALRGVVLAGSATLGAVAVVGSGDVEALLRAAVVGLCLGVTGPALAAAAMTVRLVHRRAGAAVVGAICAASIASLAATAWHVAEGTGPASSEIVSVVSRLPGTPGDLAVAAVRGEMSALVGLGFLTALAVVVGGAVVDRYSTDFLEAGQRADRRTAAGFRATTRPATVERSTLPAWIPAGAWAIAWAVLLSHRRAAPRWVRWTGIAGALAVGAAISAAANLLPNGIQTGLFPLAIAGGISLGFAGNVLLGPLLRNPLYLMSRSSLKARLCAFTVAQGFRSSAQNAALLVGVSLPRPGALPVAAPLMVLLSAVAFLVLGGDIVLRSRLPSRSDQRIIGALVRGTIIVTLTPIVVGLIHLGTAVGAPWAVLLPVTPLFLLTGWLLFGVAAGRLEGDGLRVALEEGH